MSRASVSKSGRSMDLAAVQCPTCFEWFEVALPSDPSGTAGTVELDYDCEVCCRPMVIRIDAEGVRSVGLGE